MVLIMWFQVETLSEIPKQAEAAMHLLLQAALSASEIANMEQVGSALPSAVSAVMPSVMSHCLKQTSPPPKLRYAMDARDRCCR
jgi:citrate synthase